MNEEQKARLLEAEDILIHLMHDIDDAGGSKRIVNRIDNAVSELEICLYYHFRDRSIEKHG